ncbi:RICIN domain-containing protein [Streptomyces sp. NPDC054904]|uniref:RICIN domain-containing protein n=1 Tax=unclassified Streptomyces TaxID=2593676 RepID=UPI002481C0DD|nr:RICIN domain-containing protein [Streptomyces sp. Isolate_45]MDA5282306.1 RICIN domain-containing protein [Streptomyces sp. Isolate_45]
MSVDDDPPVGPGPVTTVAPGHPPRWSWWVVGVLVPLVGALVTLYAAPWRIAPPPVAAPAPGGVVQAPASPPPSATAGATSPPPSASPGVTTPPPTPPAPPKPSAPAETAGAPPAPAPSRPAAAPPEPVVTGTPVRVVNGNSGQCLAVPGASTEVAVPVNQFPCGPHPDHFWRVEYQEADGAGRARHLIVNDNSGQCLAVPGASTGSGTQVNQFTCGDHPDHFWRVEYRSVDATGRSRYRIVNGNSGQCLAVRDASTEAAAAVVQLPCDGRAAQEWRIAP